MEEKVAHNLHNLIRKAEIEQVKPWFEPNINVLEIGGGGGFQASILNSWGCCVVSIDLPSRRIPEKTYYAVQDYDGKHIPFADATFDRVYSSCVLEHVSTQELPFLFQEIRRVLRKGGITIHILPTPSWRFWTSIEYYCHALRYLIGRLAGFRKTLPGSPSGSSIHRAVENHGIPYVINRGLLSPPHGAYSNGLLEILYYRKARWIRLFSDNEFRLVSTFGSGFFRVGSESFVKYSIQKSAKVARYLGSESRTFVLTLDRK